MEKSNFQQAVVDISKLQSAAVMEIIPITQLYRLLQHRSMLARDALSERDEQLFKMKMEAIRHLNEMCMSSGTCTHLQISDTAYVPLLIHGVMCRFYSQI